jgi:hypothetical protein
VLGGCGADPLPTGPGIGRFANRVDDQGVASGLHEPVSV